MQPDELTAPERRLWDAFPTATKVDLTAGDPGADDPARGADWGPERTVRAEVITALLLGARQAESGHTAAVRLTGARITGSLHLDHAEVQHHLRLTACSFEQRIDMYGARTRQLSFNESHFPGMLASHMWTDGSLRLPRCVATGEVRLVATRIAGALLLNGSRLSNPQGKALNGTRLQVDNDVLMREGFTADGVVELRNARIGGGLELRDARLNGAGGVAMDAARLQVEGDFSAYRMSATGKLGLRNANVTGTLFLRAATLSNPSGGRRTLDAPGAQIGADVVLDEGFGSRGEVRLAGAVIGGQLVLSGGVLEAAADGMALNAYAVQIDADAMLDDMTATGKVVLSGAQITGRIDARGARAARHRPDAIVLYLRQTRAREADLRTTVLDGGLDLRYSTLGMLIDAPGTWPARIRLDGAVYEQLHTPLPAADRLTWLCRDGGAYVPQPYEQLAATYRSLGHEDDARRVLLAKQRSRRAQLPWYGRAWGVVQDATVGYGYRPARALGWLLGLLALGAVLFATHTPRQMEPEKAPLDYNAFVYALDVLLPVVDFGQESAYAAHSGYEWLAYVLTAAGWILATAVATGVARAISRA